MKLPHLLVHRHPVRGLGATVRVAHLTDLHFGRVTPVEVQRHAVALAAAARPDLVVVTGDHVAWGTGYLGRLTDVLRGLPAPAFAVLGNHDHEVGASQVTAALRRAGIRVLVNEWTSVAGLSLVGVDDPITGHADLPRATAGLRGAAIALSHDPELAPELWRSGAAVVLSGHTHGGQLVPPRVGALVQSRVLGRRFWSGVTRTPEGTVAVSSGVGSASLRWRLGAEAHPDVLLHELEPG